jgi:hypothetical protein
VLIVEAVVSTQLPLPSAYSFRALLSVHSTCQWLFSCVPELLMFLATNFYCTVRMYWMHCLYTVSRRLLLLYFLSTINTVPVKIIEVYRACSSPSSSCLVPRRLRLLHRIVPSHSSHPLPLHFIISYPMSPESGLAHSQHNRLMGAVLRVADLVFDLSARAQRHRQRINGQIKTSLLRCC